MLGSRTECSCDTLGAAAATFVNRGPWTRVALRKKGGAPLVPRKRKRPAYDVKLSRVLNLVGFYRYPVNNLARGPLDVSRSKLLRGAGHDNVRWREIRHPKTATTPRVSPLHVQGALPCKAGA